MKNQLFLSSRESSINYTDNHNTNSRDVIKIGNEKKKKNFFMTIKGNNLILPKENQIKSQSLSTHLHTKRERKKKLSNVSYEILFENIPLFLPKKKLKKPINNKELELSLSTTCSICLEQITNLANPNCCNHDFCRDCLIKWSKECSNTCPLCKKSFHKIYIYEKNKRIEILINPKKLKVEDDLDAQFFDDGCYVCGIGGDDANLLICDMCNYHVCHFYCDKLKELPEGQWFCRDCKKQMKEQKKLRRKIGRLYTEH